MPDMRRDTLYNAIAYLEAANISYSYVVYDGLYEGDTAYLGFTDFYALLVRLETLGATLGTEVDEETVVIFQSVPAGSDPAENETIILVCVNYAEFIY